MRPEAGFRGEGVQFRVRHFFFLNVIAHAVIHHFDVIAILIADVDRLCEVRKVNFNIISISSSKSKGKTFEQTLQAIENFKCRIEIIKDWKCKGKK